MAKRVSVFLEFLKSWGWLVFSAIIAVVFSAGNYTGINSEKVSGLESFRTEQRKVNEQTTQKLNEIDAKVTGVNTKLDDFLSRRNVATH